MRKGAGGARRASAGAPVLAALDVDLQHVDLRVPRAIHHLLQALERRFVAGDAEADLQCVCTSELCGRTRTSGVGWEREREQLWTASG